MGFLRKKKDKTNQSISTAGKNGASLITKESNAAVIAPAAKSKKGSMRQVSKAKLTTTEDDKQQQNRHSHRHDSSEPYSPTATEYSGSGGEDGDSYTREVTEEPRDSSKGRGPWFTSRSTKLFKKPPPAQQAAYTGPPRFDWVDIETAAAIKVQAAYRRRRVMNMMEEEGAPTTSAVRNAARRRKAAKEAAANPAQDFVNLFNCCGVDLGLGGGNKESYYDITREMETARYEEQLKEKHEREEMLRKSYKKRPVRESVVENVEVVQ